MIIWGIQEGMMWSKEGILEGVESVGERVAEFFMRCYNDEFGREVDGGLGIKEWEWERNGDSMRGDWGEERWRGVVGNIEWSDVVLASNG